MFRRIGLVRGVLRLSIIAVAALLLAAGLAACGGGGDSSSSTTETATQGQPSKETSTAKKAKKKSQGKSEGKKKSSGSGGGEGSSAKSASDFTPKHHNDSGGGSKKFRVKGGDNSVQDFGKEAASSEFDAAAIALHNFLDARAEWNWAAACEYMSKSMVKSFEQLASRSKQMKEQSCAEILEALTNPAAKQLLKEEAAKANVGSLRIEGDRSFVIYTGLEGTIMAMPMTNEDGAWKVDSLASTPLN